MKLRWTAAVPFSLALSLFFLWGLASGEGVSNLSELTGNAFSQAAGVAGVNMGAGDGHCQTNLWGFGLHGEGPTGWIEQVATATEPPLQSTDLIGGYAFSGFRGVASINQASGSGTAEANMLLMGVDTTSVGDGILEQATGGLGGVRETAGTRSDIIGGHAFEGACGIVQVNQSAGMANALSNRIVINTKTLR